MPHRQGRQCLYASSFRGRNQVGKQRAGGNDPGIARSTIRQSDGDSSAMVAALVNQCPVTRIEGRLVMKPKIAVGAEYLDPMTEWLGICVRDRCMGRNRVTKSYREITFIFRCDLAQPPRPDMGAKERG